MELVFNQHGEEESSGHLIAAFQHERLHWAIWKYVMGGCQWVQAEMKDILTGHEEKPLHQEDS